MKLDRINCIILEELQNNARVSVKDIAAKANISSPTVTERLSKIEEAGIIDSYRANLNMEKIGYSLGVYISIKIRFGHVERFEKHISEIPEIFECHILTGHDCMLMKGYVRDPKHLEELNSNLSIYGELTTSLILSSLVKYKTHVPKG